MKLWICDTLFQQSNLCLFDFVFLCLLFLYSIFLSLYPLTPLATLWPLAFVLFLVRLFSGGRMGAVGLALCSWVVISKVSKIYGRQLGWGLWPTYPGVSVFCLYCLLLCLYFWVICLFNFFILKGPYFEIRYQIMSKL